MFKRYVLFVLMSGLFIMPSFAEDSIFSNSNSQQFELQPTNYTSKPVVEAKEGGTQVVNSVQSKAKAASSELANKNYTSAIANLDNVEVELREQMASYSALMAQAKTNYETRRDEYKALKKEYNALKKKMKNIEKTKKIINSNISATK